MRARKAVVVGVMLTLASGWACAQTIYRLTDLGTLVVAREAVALPSTPRGR